MNWGTEYRSGLTSVEVPNAKWRVMHRNSGQITSFWPLPKFFMLQVQRSRGSWNDIISTGNKSHLAPPHAMNSE